MLKSILLIVGLLVSGISFAQLDSIPNIDSQEVTESTIHLEEDLEIVDDFEPDENYEDAPFVFSEDMPTCGGCDSLEGNQLRHQCTMLYIQNFVRDSIEIPIQDSLSAKDKKVSEGGVTIYARFVVTKTGEIGEVILLRASETVYDKCVTDVIRKLPLFHPGTVKGEPRSFYYTLPVRIQVN